MSPILAFKVLRHSGQVDPDRVLVVVSSLSVFAFFLVILRICSQKLEICIFFSDDGLPEFLVHCICFPVHVVVAFIHAGFKTSLNVFFSLPF